MAYIYRHPGERADKTQEETLSQYYSRVRPDLKGQPPKIGGPSATLTGGGEPTRTQQLTPGWVNLQRYTDINRPQAMTERLAERMGVRGREIQKAGQLDIPQYDPSEIESRQEALRQVAEDPTQIEEGRIPEIQKQFQQLYQGVPRQEMPEDFQERFGKAYAEHRAYSPLLEGLGEHEGRMQALREMEMGAQTRGGTMLDAALMGLDPTATETLEQVQQEYQAPKFEDIMGRYQAAQEAESDITAQEQALRDLYGKYGQEKEMVEAGHETAMQGYQSNISNLQGEQQLYQQDIEGSKQAINDLVPENIDFGGLDFNTATPEDVLNILMQQGTVQYGQQWASLVPEIQAQLDNIKNANTQISTIQQDINALVQPTMAAQFDTPEEYARYQALQNILQGIEEPEEVVEPISEMPIIPETPKENAIIGPGEIPLSVPAQTTLPSDIIAEGIEGGEVGESIIPEMPKEDAIIGPGEIPIIPKGQTSITPGIIGEGTEEMTPEELEALRQLAEGTTQPGLRQQEIII